VDNLKWKPAMGWNYVTPFSSYLVLNLEYLQKTTKNEKNSKNLAVMGLQDLSIKS
jgi:hypothetical protein